VRAIWERFDFVLFNKFELDTRDKGDALFSFLGESLALPIPERARATLWSMMTDSLQPYELKKELAEIGAAFNVSDERLDSQDPWWGAISTAIEQHAKSSDPVAQELVELLERIDDDDRPVAQCLKLWSDEVAAAATIVLVSRTSTGDAVREATPSGTNTPATGLSTWMKQRLGIEDLAPASFAAEIVNEIQRLPSRLTAADVLDFCSAARMALEEMRTQLDAWLARIPPAELLHQRAAECSAAYAAASASIPLAFLDEYLSSFSLEPRELQEVADLCRDSALWSNLPRWWWPEPDRGSELLARFEEQFPAALWLVAFAHLPSRNLADFVRKKVAAFPALASDYTLLRSIPSPENGVPSDIHLEQRLRELAETAGALAENQRRYSSTLRVLLADAILSQGEFVRICEHLNRIADLTSQSTADELATELAVIRDVQNLVSRLDGYRARIDQLRVLVPTLMRKMTLAEIAPTEESLIQHVSAIEIDHVYVGDGTKTARRAPTLFFRPLNDDPGHAFGTVAVPILLRAGSRSDWSLRFDYVDDVGSRLRGSWPVEHGGDAAIFPAALRVEAKQWSQGSDGERLSHSIVCRVPIRRPKDNDHLGLAISVHDQRTGSRLGVAKRLEWSRIESAHDVEDPRPSIRIDWSEAVVVDYAKNHPVGPQRQQHIQRLQERILAGNSIAVIAPRRFGKSTLIEFMTQRLEEQGVLTIHESCDNYRLGSAPRINHAALWAEIARRLPMTIPEDPPHLDFRLDDGDPPLPVPESFDRLRRAAALHSKKGVLVFLDEAQLFFGVSNSLELATRVRNLLSKRLSRREPGMVPLMLGFVGLPTLNRKRLGELFPILQPIDDVKLHESELYQLISRFTGDRLQTTREARERIVDSSANLLILNRMLSKVSDIVRDDYRPWVTRDDVLMVEEDIKKRLRQGANPDSIKDYLLDVLNESVTPTDWRPIAAYPVALAIAVARAAGFRDEDAVVASEVILQDWIDKIFGDPDSTSGRPAYDLQRIREHLQMLRDIGVLKADHRFVSEFLEAALVGIGRDAIPDDDEFREALFRGGLRFLRLPPDLVKIAAGAQATIYRGEQGKLAIRAVEVKTDADRERFIERVAVYESLREFHRNNDERAANIMNLRGIGLAKIGGVACAVQTYSWVDGRPLEEHGNPIRLPPRVIVRLGRLLSSCLALVHERGIIHRDVSARNIILQERSMAPVLIDFGFATYIGHGKTQLPNEDAAPEVRGLPAHWSPAADVYALARTLQRCMDSQHASAKRIQSLLGRFVSDSPSKRGTMTELERSLQDEEGSLENGEACEALLSQLAQSLGKDYEACKPVLQKRRKDLDGLALGLFSDPFERSLMIANLINQIAESKGSSIGEWMRARGAGPAWVFQTLRNMDAHGAPDFSEARRQLNKTKPGTQLIEGASAIGTWLGMSNLRDAVKFLVQWEPPS
jgi:tRNA A-37 threonylcarbamoyl transferase component Bud32